MEMQGNQLLIVEIKPEDVSLEEVKPEVENLEESKYPIDITPDKSEIIEITPEYDEDEMSIKPDFQVHVAVQDEKIIDAGPEIYNPIEVKTEYEWLKTDTDTEVNTEYEQSTKAEIEEVNAQYNQATDQSRPRRTSLEETELNQHQEEVSQEVIYCKLTF